MLTIDGKKYLTTAEAAVQLGVPEGTVRQWLHRGQLTALPKRDPRDRTYIAAAVVSAFDKRRKAS